MKPTNRKSLPVLVKYLALFIVFPFFSKCQDKLSDGLTEEKSNAQVSVDETYRGNLLFNSNLKFFRYRPRSKDSADGKPMRERVIKHLKDLDVWGVRESVGVLEVNRLKRRKGSFIDFPYMDSIYRRLDEEGIRYATELRLDRVVANPDNFGPVWEENARYVVEEIGKYYGTKPLYYSAVNEPFLPGMREDGVPLTVDQVMRVQEVVYTTLKAVNPEIVVLSCPISGGRIDKGVELAERGITQYCDYFGVHKHNDIGEDGHNEGGTDVWRIIDRAEEMGYPRRPMVMDENGTRLTLPQVWEGATEADARTYKARWIGNDLVQMKALGFKYIVMYAVIKSQANGGEYNILDKNRPLANGFERYEREYQAYKELWRLEPHLLSNGINGGFEEANPDKSRGWVVCFKGNPRIGMQTSVPQEWESVDFVKNDPSGAFKGNNYLKMSKPVRPLTQISANRCRRLVEGLTPGQRYKLCARVKLTGAASKANLRAMGFDVLGKEKAEKEVTYAESDGKYVHAEVSFVAGNEWAVISLEHNGAGTASWDEITFTK